MYQELSTDRGYRVGLSIIADECDEATEMMIIDTFFKDIVGTKLGRNDYWIKVKSKRVTCSSLKKHLDSVRTDASALRRGLASTALAKGFEPSSYDQTNEASMLTPLWSTLYDLETNCDVVIFGPIADPILRLLKEMVLTAVHTWETVFCKQFTMVVLKKQRIRDMVNPKFPILTDAEIEDVKCYCERVEPLMAGKYLTLYMKKVEINRLRRLRTAMLGSTEVTSEELARFYKYNWVILNGIKYNLDWSTSKTNLGIPELMAKYGTK